MDTGVLPKPIPFGKYCLLEKISVGGMAEVYKAKAFGVEGFERLLAVKKILNSIAEDETFISMFIDEAKIAGQLNHPHIAQIFDLGRVDGSYFIALEYISGRDLRTVWDRFVRDASKPNIFLACFIIMKVAEALHYAHTKRDASGQELNIVHRDISPHNVLVSYEGDVKIIDFGIAKAQGKSSQTQVGILKGKFSYMSPEQVRGLHIDHRADLFSLGIVLYEILTQERLFLGESDFDTLEKIRKVEMSPPTLYNPHIPRELEDIVLKSLAKSPDDRFQTGAELVEALERFFRNQGSFFGTKDLAAVMKKTFAAEIELERKKLDYYRTINLDSLTQQNNRPMGWDHEELDTRVYGRAQHGAPPMPPPAAPHLGHFGDINPAAELGSPAPIRTPEADIVYKTGERPVPVGGVLPGLPGVNELLQDEDELDDPTMEFDRWQVGQSLTPKVQESAPADPLDAALRSPSPRSTPAPPPPRNEPSLFGAPDPPRSTPPRAAPARPVERPAEKGGSSGLTLVLVAVIVLLLLGGGGAAWYFVGGGAAKEATVTFKINNASNVRILVDKEELHSGSADAPVVLKGIEAGSRKIEIVADGYETVMDNLQVEAGQQYVLPIEMRKAPEVGKAAVSVKVDPADATVLLNGEAVKDPAPFSRRDLQPGKAELIFKKDGYFDEKREVDLTEGKTVDVDVRLKPSRVALSIKPDPDDAEVTVYLKDTAAAADKRKLKTQKGAVELKDLDATKVYEVEIAKKGYAPYTKLFEPGFEASKTLLAQLEAEAATEPVANANADRLAEERRKRLEERINRANENRDRNPGKTDPPATVAAVVATAPPERKDPDPPVTGTGIINVASKPQARVFIDGKDTGRYTPLLNHSISAGAHLVTLKNEEQGLNKTYNITVKPGGSQQILNIPK